MTKRPSLASSMKALQEPTAPDAVALVAQAQAAPPVAVPRPVREAGERYAGMKKALIPLHPEVHQQLRIIALRQGSTLEKVMQAAAADYIKQHAS